MILTFLLAVLVLLTGCNLDSPPPPTPVGPQPIGWQALYSAGVTVDAIGSFAFPLAPGSVHYVLKGATGPAAGSVTLSFDIVGDQPVFNGNLAPDNTCA